MDNGMDFKKMEEMMSVEIHKQDERQEQAGYQQRMMEPQQKFEQQEEELPAEKLLKERKTMPVIRGKAK